MAQQQQLRKHLIKDPSLHLPEILAQTEMAPPETERLAAHSGRTTPAPADSLMPGGDESQTQLFSTFDPQTAAAAATGGNKYQAQY